MEAPFRTLNLPEHRLQLQSPPLALRNDKTTNFRSGVVASVPSNCVPESLQVLLNKRASHHIASNASNAKCACYGSYQTALKFLALGRCGFSDDRVNGFNCVSRLQVSCRNRGGGWKRERSRRPAPEAQRSSKERWDDFFADPSQWWDHRENKMNPRFPDFKHKQTLEGLWLDSRRTPPWVGAKLDTIPQGALQASVFVWNHRLYSATDGGQYERTIELFRQMQREGINVNKFSFVPVLNACAALQILEEGKRIHSEMVLTGFESDNYVSNALVDMYSKCGSIEDAWMVFNKMPKRNVVAWSTIILGYVKSGDGLKALQLWHQMRDEGVEPNQITYLGLLSACANEMALDEGKRVHELIVQSGCESDIFVASSLVDMYAKCGSIENARKVFDNMPVRNVVAWTAMILGYVKCGQGLKALRLSDQMQSEGVEPIPVVFAGLLSACASVLALERGRRVHSQVIQSGCETHSYVANSLIAMYARCGSIDEAKRVFNKMRNRTVVDWAAMLRGFAVYGLARDAIELFEQMCKSNVEIDEVTFTNLLSACSHGGLVDEGLRYFESMSSVYGIMPTRDHYACAIGLFGRAGRMSEADELIKTMPVEPNSAVWNSLLTACRIHGNVELGEIAARRVWDLDPGNASAFVLLSQMYAAVGDLDSLAGMEKMMEETCVKRKPARTWIEICTAVHSFTVADRTHPQIPLIHSQLESLFSLMEMEGYVPVAKFVLHDVEDELSVSDLCQHSEKLAIALGLICTPPGTTLRILKNMRLCEDCHTAIKLISKVVGRVIIARDPNRFHEFKDGLCSCKDYW